MIEYLFRVLGRFYKLTCKSLQNIKVTPEKTKLNELKMACIGLVLKDQRATGTVSRLKILFNGFYTIKKNRMKSSNVGIVYHFCTSCYSARNLLPYWVWNTVLLYTLNNIYKGISEGVQNSGGVLVLDNILRPLFQNNRNPYFHYDTGVLAFFSRYSAIPSSTK